ncbi:hypothetical protein PASE110613_14485 [Paenibacillus sediminis]|uniref:Uncharacterized protein n=1 Tax=Paenibacillus sediminis TaxID=664909 RepID=A0ABS4H7K5_9BACL|nr:hypothetical protein [Paenibacillus sediminis]
MILSLKRNREIRNTNRKDMKIPDMSFSVSKENQRLLAKLNGRANDATNVDSDIINSFEITPLFGSARRKIRELFKKR